MSCGYYLHVRSAGRTVAEALTEQGSALYGSQLGAIVITFCEHCACYHVAVVTRDGAVRPRALQAVENALNALEKEETQHVIEVSSEEATDRSRSN